MKKYSIIIILMITGLVLQGQNLKPYTVGFSCSKNLNTALQEVENAMVAEGFEIVGSYTPAHDKNTRIVGFTSPVMLKAVAKAGNLAGFAAVWKIGFTMENGETVVTYNTPQYWGNAYFQKEYKKVEKVYNEISVQLHQVMKTCGGEELTFYGSEEGLDEKRLQNYRYKVLMPKFDDTEIVGKFDNFEEAVTTIEANLSEQPGLFAKVYSVKVPNKDIQLFGIGLLGEDGEKKFMPKIDFNQPRHAAFLPYEILVVDNKVHMLEGKYRIALSFPDLSMGTFMKIVSTPGDIKDYMKKVCEKRNL